MKIDALFAALIGAMLCPPPAQAEPILINEGGGGKGQGWLFGSPADASCWIATARHVVATADGTIKDFQWSDLQGREGLGFDAVAPAKDLDLAFARAEGRRPGECMSRLGGDDLSFIVARQPVVEAMQMLKTHAEPRQMTLRDFSGEYVRFTPTNDDSRRAMKPGLSGAPLVLRDVAGADRPIGLIANVDPSQDFGLAVRFDTIKRAFLASAAAPSSALPHIKDVAFVLAGSTGISRDAASTALAARDGEGCWVARAPDGARSFSVEIEPRETGAKFEAVVVEVDAACGPAPDGFALEKRQGGGWITIGACVAIADGAVCRSGGHTLDRMRLTVIARSGTPVAIRKISLR